MYLISNTFNYLFISLLYCFFYALWGFSMKKNNSKLYVRPEDILGVTLRNIRKWKSLDKIEMNLEKMLLYFKDERYDKLEEEFNLERS